MRETTVHYELTEEQEKRLNEINQAYRNHGITMTEDEMFEFIMTTGCVIDIDRRLKMHEEMAQRFRIEVKDESNM